MTRKTLRGGLGSNSIISTYLTLENCLFGAVSLAKNGDTDKYKYSGHGIGFDRHGFFLILVVELVDM